MAEFEEGSFKLFGRTIQVAKERGGDHQGVRDTTSTADPPCRDGAPSLRRPERSLPCPRCRSLNTKFCYYNNYKANQPRHFCRSCQRYWTAGGAMRNVPVGSGRRKSKCSALRPPPANVGASTVLSFGSPREKARWTEEEATVKNCTNACYYWVGPPQNLLGTSIEGTGSVEPAGSDPEVMRIDDPSEAARSSIWLTVGGGGSMKAFEAKKKGGGTSVVGNSNKNSLVASSNPAAFSRAINFQETT